MITTSLKNYSGNKSISGLWQFIINRIPPHSIYYELFAGSATIAKKLNDSPAVKYIIDCNAGVLDTYICTDPSKEKIICADALQIIPTLLQNDKNTFIYMDPPYRFVCRRSTKRLYKYEMTDVQHIDLLRLSSKVKCNCMISHPSNDMYDYALKGWTKEKFIVSYHGKIAEECIYYNYTKPIVLQLYDYVGTDCWDRQRIKRKIDSLSKKLINLPALERNAIIDRVIKKTH